MHRRLSDASHVFVLFFIIYLSKQSVGKVWWLRRVIWLRVQLFRFQYIFFGVLNHVRKSFKKSKAKQKFMQKAFSIKSQDLFKLKPPATTLKFKREKSSKPKKQQSSGSEKLLRFGNDSSITWSWLLKVESWPTTLDDLNGLVLDQTDDAEELKVKDFKSFFSRFKLCTHKALAWMLNPFGCFWKPFEHHKNEFNLLLSFQFD